MKYINANKLKADINELIDALKRKCEPNAFCTTVAAAEIEVLDLVIDIIDKQMKDERIPTTDKESKKKGWLDFGLTMSVIGLHRDGAKRRIKEHKDKFDPVSIPDYIHVASYYQALGIDLICNCLQSYCKNSMFTQEEVNNILEQED